MSNTVRKNIINLSDGSLHLDETLRRVTLQNIDIQNPGFFHLLKKKENLAEQIEETRKVIEIGSFVKSKVEMVMDTDFVETRVKDMTHEFQNGMRLIQKEVLEQVDKNFDPAQAESYSARMNRFFQEKSREFEETALKTVRELTSQQKQVQEKLEKAFDPENRNSYLGKMITFVDTFRDDLEKQFDVKRGGSLTHELKEMLLRQFGKDGELLRAVDSRFSLDNGDSFASKIFSKLEEIKEEVKAAKSAEEARAQLVQSTPQKGYLFEEVLEQALEEYAARQGDLVENMTTSAGNITRSKKGDFVYTVSAIDKRIVIEAKSTPMKTPRQVLERMQATMENRHADYVIYLTEKEEQLHRQVGLFQEYDGNKLITHFGLLEVALKVAAGRLLLENSEIEGIDRVQVEAELNGVQSALKSFRSIKTAAGNIRKEADKILEQSEKIRDEIGEVVKKLDGLLLNSR